MNFARSAAKDRVGAFLGNSFNAANTVATGMEAEGYKERSAILEGAKQDYYAETGQAYLDKIDEMKSAQSSGQSGEMAKQIGGTLFNVAKTALGPATGGVSNFVPNPFSFM